MPVVNHIIQVLDTYGEYALRGKVGLAYFEEPGRHMLVLLFDRRGSDTSYVEHRDCRILITGDDLAALANTIAREVPHATPT